MSFFTDFWNYFRPPPLPSQRDRNTPNLPASILNGPLATTKPTFQIESDWHLEQNPDEYTTWPRNFPFSGDFLLLAGDCGGMNDRLGANKATINHEDRYLETLQNICPKYKHVFLIGGNNEPKSANRINGPSLENSIQRLMQFQLKIPNLTVLEEQSADLSGLGYDITILGCTLWSEIRDDAAPGSGDVGGWTGETNLEHNLRFRESYRWIRDEVQRIRKERPSHRIIIMTHHAPTVRGSAQPAREFSDPTESTRGDQFSGYQNDILGGEGVLGLRPGDHWVFGHTHFSCDFEQDEVHCVSNQRGGARNDAKLDDTNYRKGQVVIRI